MNNDIVIMDLLASMTADALFGLWPKPPASPKRTSRWRAGGRPRSLPAKLATTVGGLETPPTAAATLDDDWVGGWYARTRQLQATALAQAPASAKAGSAGGAPRVDADIVHQIKDFS